MLATKNLDDPRGKTLGKPTNQTQNAPPQDEEDIVQISDGHRKKQGGGRLRSDLHQMHKNLKDESLKYLAGHRSAGAESTWRTHRRGNNGIRPNPSSPYELKLYLAEILFDLVLGKSSSSRVAMMSSSDGSSSFLLTEQSTSAFFAMNFSGGSIGIFGGNGNGVDAAARAGWRIESFQYESEEVSYQAQGVINTADGRTINVDISMYMSRQFVSYMNIDVEVTKRLTDPLVINYGGTAASLTGEQFMFDLTSDGNLESLAMLSEGSGFLALDKNGDGTINDGSELFGPSTGCGFSELRQYDTDGNGWIDEADEIFDKLVVWSRDKDGNDVVYTLKELGIGAIYLGDIATEFSFKDENNETLGVMRSTSFFLKECGGAGTVSHIDLSV